MKYHTGSNKIYLAEKNLERVNKWMEVADKKANIILAFNGGLFALLLGSNIFTSDFFAQVKSSHGLSIVEYIGATVFLIFVGFFALSVYSALRVLMLDVRRTKCEKNVLFSFLGIAEITREHYRERFEHVDIDEALHGIMDQTHITSEIVARKIQHSARGWKFLAGGIASCILFIVFTLLV